MHATGAHRNPIPVLTARGVRSRDILQLFDICVGGLEYLQWGTLQISLSQAMQLSNLKSTLGQLAFLPQHLQLPAAHGTQVLQRPQF